MWRYRQPEFALHLLCELQKQQQQCSLHCDTLLQTEGISIPAHSCVLSALSPVLSRVFAHSTSLPVGQSRLLKLQAVGTRALLKLVGFIYSGEVEAEGFDEQQEVIDVAYKLGFSNLINGKKMQVNSQPEKRISWKEIGLQTEETSGGKKDVIIQVLSEKARFTHSATQTDRLEAPRHVSECDLSVALPDELTAVPRRHNSNSPTAGHDYIGDDASSSSSIHKAFVRGPSKCQQIQRNKKRAKILQKQTGTHISLKIKMKRKMRGALWEIVSVQEEIGTDGSRMRGSSVSERCTADSGLTQSHTEDGTVLTQTRRNTTEVQLSPPPMFTCQNLDTVTLTPPSDLTTSSPARHPSERSCLYTPHPVPLSSPLQTPPLSPGLPQHEESDEHIARLLEDMVMMGLNILPSVSMERISDVQHSTQVCSHLDLKADNCEDATASPAQCFCVHDLEARGYGIGKTSGSCGPSLTGSEGPASENQSTHRSVGLNNVASVEVPTSFADTPPCRAPEKPTESSFLLCADQEKVFPSDLSFGLEMPHQNVREVMNVMSNLFWSANSVVQVMTEVGDHSENVQISRTPSRKGGLNDVNGESTVIKPNSDFILPAETQCPDDLSEFPLTTDQVSAIVQPLHSSHAVNFSEMRIPKCLSPLALEAPETGTFLQSPVRPLDTCNELRVDLKRTLIDAPEQQCLPDHPNSLSTLSNVNHLQSSEVGLGPGYSRSNKDNIKEASGCELEQEKNKGQTFENQVLEGTEDSQVSQTTMPKQFMVNESDKRKNKIIGYLDTGCLNRVDVQPSNMNTDAPPGIGKTQLTSSPKIDYLKAKTGQKSSTAHQFPLENLRRNSEADQPVECIVQDKCREDMPSNQSDLLVEKLECERPSKKRKHVEDLEQNVSKVKKLNSSCTGFKASTSFGYHNSLLRQRHVQNEDNDLVLDKQSLNNEPNLGDPSRGKLSVGLAQTLKDLEGSSTSLQMSPDIDRLDLQKTKGTDKEECEENKAQEIRNASQEFKTADPALILNPGKSNQSNTYSQSTKILSLSSKIFHQTSFNGKTTVKESLLPQQLSSNLQNAGKSQRAENTFPKSSTSPPVNFTLKKFRGLQDLLSSRKSVMDIKQKEVKDVAVESETLTRAQRDKQDLKNRTDSDQGNGSLVDGKSTETDESQTDETANFAIYSTPVLSSHAELTSCSYTDVLVTDLNNNLEMETNPPRESTETGDFNDKTISESFRTTLSSTEEMVLISDVMRDLHCTESVKTQIVNFESCVVLNNENVVEVTTSSETEISDAEVDVLDDGSWVTTCDEDAAAHEWIMGETLVEENQSCVGMDDGGATACEEELRTQQIVATEVPASADNSWWSDISSSPESSFGLKSTKNSDCDEEEEEEVIVDDVSDSPDVVPCSLLSSQHVTILTNDENDLEEDEEVDVTGLGV